MRGGDERREGEDGERREGEEGSKGMGAPCT